MMNSRERVVRALNHQVPDRVPIDFDSTPVSGMHVTCVAALRDYYGLEKRPVKIHEPFQMLGQIEDDLRDAIGIDVIGVNGRNTMFGFPNENWKSWRFNGLEVLVPEKFNTTTDEAGNTYIYPAGDLNSPPSGKMPEGGYYFDAIIRQEPIDEEALNPEDNLEEYQPISDEDLTYFENAIKDAAAKGKAVIANFGGTGLGDIALVPGPGLRYPKGIRDVQEWYISTVTRREYIHQVFAKQTEIALENLAKLNQRIGGLVDVVFVCGTDFGTQVSTFCSEKTFRELWLPYYRRINQWIHRNTRWKTFKHSCGAIEPFINAFIEAGFDILNPVQCSAAGMDPELLKSKYGDRVVFWGGGVDTQRTLPFGTPREVRDQVLRRCEIFSKNGGFVFNAIHNVQANTPIANIVAMIDAVHEFNGDR
ncbi:MAG: methyltransferase [Firmicutes bacterium]|nr:methyltransferase [Bacillota bacterium]